MSGISGLGRAEYEKDMDYLLNEILLKNRDKWDLESAIEKTKKLFGGYSNHKEFIDALFRDGVLTREEYDDVRGEDFFVVQKGMDYLRALLISKNISAGEAESVSGG